MPLQTELNARDVRVLERIISLNGWRKYPNTKQVRTGLFMLKTPKFYRSIEVLERMGFIELKESARGRTIYKALRKSDGSKFYCAKPSVNSDGLCTITSVLS